MPDGSSAELQYKVLKEGTGEMPKTTDTVSVNYRGTFIDGKEFDSSAKHGGQPAKFPVTGVVRGWTEALQMMKVGSKWELYLPSSLAYGDRGNPRGTPPIDPGATLIFEMELVGTETPPPPPTPQPLTSDIIKVPSAEELEERRQDRSHQTRRSRTPGGPGPDERGQKRQELTRAVAAAGRDPRALFQPRAAQLDERFAFKHAFGEREDNPFFPVEMPAGISHRVQQQPLGLLEPRGLLNEAQGAIHLEMLLDKGVALANLLEAMLKRPQEQGVLNIRVRFEHGFDHRRQGFDFAQRLQFWSHGFEMIEHVLKHQVFREQGFRYFHRAMVANL